MTSKFTLEICANSVESAIIAQKGGAQRVELCDNIHEGGTTPSQGAIEFARNILRIDLNIIIRPRGGDFIYSDIEFEIMKRDIAVAKKTGINGVVFGLLSKNGNIDKARTKELVELAQPMSVTFHRAFDVCKDPFKGLEDIIDCGCNRILTSGMQNKAIDGIELIRNLIDKANNRITIMPGSGINEHNIAKIYKHTGATEFHASLRKTVNSKMEFRKEGINMGGIPGINEFEILLTDQERVKETTKILNTF